MKKVLSIILLIILTVITFNTLSYSQATGVIGKLYTKSAADQTYGMVNTSVTVNTLTIQQAMEKSSDYLMFNIINGNLIILSGKREVLYSADFTTKSVSSSIVFHVFSVSKIKELIEKGGNNPFTNVELRDNNVLTITNGVVTIEMSQVCPPFCP